MKICDDNIKKRQKRNKTKEGLRKLLGETVTLFCANYIYTGKLIAVNDSYVLLTDAGIVYETGSFDSKYWKDMQKLPQDWYVMTQSIESFGLLLKEE